MAFRPSAEPSVIQSKLVCCIDSPGYGGSEIDLLRFLRLFPAHHMAIVHGDRVCETISQFVHEAGLESVVSESRNGASAILGGLFKAWRIMRRFPKAVFVVWAHHSDSNRWLQLALAVAKRRIVVVERSVPPSRSSFKKSRLSIPIKKFVVDRADRIIVNGHCQVEHYRRLFGVRRGRIICIRGSRPVGAIRDRIRELRMNGESLKGRLGVPETPVVICVGRLSEEKNQRSLLVAMSDSSPGLRSKATLVLVGDGPERAALERDARALMPGRVVFAGYQTDPLPWLASADLFVLPSRLEGLPGALIEAMAANVPCVATDILGNSELVQDGRTGLLIPVDCPEQLRQAIERMLEDHTFASQCARAAYELVQRDYDESRENGEWRGLIQELMAQTLGG